MVTPANVLLRQRLKPYLIVHICSYNMVKALIVRLLPIILGYSLCSNVYSESISSKKLSELDWVRKEHLTEEQRENCPETCRGAYIAPERTDEDAKLPPGASPIRGEADSSEINTDAATAFMQGDVVFTQGWRKLQSERVEIDRTKGTLKLDGKVSIREPGILLIGNSAYIDSSTDQVDIKGAEYLFHEQRIRGSASNITRSPSTGIAIDNASYTACEPGDEAWVLYADRIRINETTGRASAKGVRIETAGVPVFYAPYFQFIVDDRRATGLLYPSIGYSDDEGFEYSQPVYIDIAPNQDLTLTPKISTNRGSGLEAEHRLLTENSFTRSAGAFYPSDDVNPEHSDERWAAAVTHRSNHDRGWGKWASQIDFADISDDDFLEDRDTNVVEANSRDLYLRQYAGISIELEHWNLQASATDYQNLINDDEDQYRELPRITFDGHYKLSDNLHLALNNEWTSFDRDQSNNLLASTALLANITNAPLFSQIANDGTWVTGDRSRANWSLSWNKKNTWGFFKPNIAVNYLSYNLDAPLLGSSDDSPSIFAPEASLDTGLTFERETSLFGTPALQTLEPRFYYLYRDSESQTDIPVFDTALATESLEQLFRDSSFVGGDRLEDTSQISLGLRSRFYSTESSREILSLGIGQTYYLRDKRTQLGNVLTTGFSTNSINSFGTPTIFAPPVAFQPFTTNAFVATPFANSSITSSALAALLADARDRLNEQQRDRSDIVTEAIWNFSKSLTVKGSIFWNDQRSDLERSRLEFSYRPAETGHFLKLAYTQEDNNLTLRDNNRNGIFEASEIINEDVEQVSLSGQWSVSERWKILFLWREDLENSRNLDKVAGVSYESCCWNLSLSWRSELIRVDNGGFITESPRRDSGVFLHFEFSGLGGLGTSGRNLIEDR